MSRHGCENSDPWRLEVEEEHSRQRKQSLRGPEDLGSIWNVLEAGRSWAGWNRQSEASRKTTLAGPCGPQ